ncbi:MAG TPA: hypothetical protein VLG50_01475, partial [Candidatus Saccharimonadales bacterium]|nr:hypothetical protein [Candidatus Saccharimonadales bacterium]
MKKSMILSFCFTSHMMMGIPEVESFDTEHQKAQARAERRAQKALEEEALLKSTREAELNRRFNEQERAQRPLEERGTKRTTVAAEPVRTQSTGVHLDLAPHERDSKTGRSPFEEAVKSKDLEKAKQLWEQSRDSNVTTEEFVAHLKERYSKPASLAELYPGKSYDQARDAFAKDLQTVSPHVANVLSDSFIKENKAAPKPQARTDKPYFDWLEKNPMRLLTSDKAHEETPLETAIRENNPEMGEKLIELAKDYSAKNPKNKITPLQLLDPVINEYKKIKNSSGEQAAFDYALKT